MDTAPASISPTNPPDTVFIDELTWEETRDLMKAGKTRVIIPTGGTEKNGYHMVLGKHNYIVTFAANQMARQLGNTLVAPTIQFVPEGGVDSQGPGEISHPSPAYDLLLDAACRSLKAHGFKEILLIGDSGGNQRGLTDTATKLNAEWKDSGTRVYALTDYYVGGRNDYNAWVTKTFGYDSATIGSHAGISDTSQLLHVRPAGVRKDQDAPGRERHACVQRERLAASRDLQELHVPLGREWRDRFGSAVGRAVRHDDQLARTVVGQGEQIGQPQRQACALVPRGEDDRDRGPAAGRELVLLRRPRRQPRPGRQQQRIARVDIGNQSR